MRKGSLAAVLIITIAVLGLALFSFDYLKDDLRLGLDLKGGVQVRLEAPENASAEDMAKAVAIIDNRVNALGVTEPEIRREGDNRILIELPGVEDPEEAVNLIGRTALLEFVRVDTNEIVVTGRDLKNAVEGMDSSQIAGKDYHVSIEFNSEGAEKFANATSDLVAKYGENDPNRMIAIVLDGNVISSPIVQTPIYDGKASISGGFQTLEEANELALLLRSGALPIEMEIIEKRTVGPKFGIEALEKSAGAAFYGLIAIALFMIAYYRVPGLVAVVSLVLYSAIVWNVLGFINATITLPGIAGFLLSVGMAVDANIIIYERIKEELANGKSLRASIDSGFKRAIWTIFDSNLTTLIASFVLIYFGAGTVKGFAVTLSIGVITSMLTAITFTKILLKQTSLVISNTKLYGA